MDAPFAQCACCQSTSHCRKLHSCRGIAAVLVEVAMLILMLTTVGIISVTLRVKRIQGSCSASPCPSFDASINRRSLKTTHHRITDCSVQQVIHSYPLPNPRFRTHKRQPSECRDSKTFHSNHDMHASIVRPSFQPLPPRSDWSCTSHAVPVSLARRT